MKRNPVFLTALRFGIGAAALGVLWVLFLYWTGQNPLGPKRTVAYLVPPVAALASQWFVRRYYSEGPGLLKAWGTGLATVLVAASLSAIGVYGVGRMGGTKLLQRNLAEESRLLDAARKEFGTDQLNQEVYAQAKRSLPLTAGTPQGVANVDFQKKMLLGLLLSIPGGIFFRK
ncbi:DUF4199 domain-containing protein [Hymenobacter koreensis]